MVGMIDLRDVRWGLWDEAAPGWREFADQAVYAGKDIRDQGKAKLDKHWTDNVGEAAGKVLGGLANEYDIASDVMRSVSMILIGLAEAVEVAQRELQTAIELARAHYLRVNDDGTCGPWDQPDSQGDNGHTEAMEWKPKIEAMIRDAVEAANQADALAAEQLRRLRDGVNLTDASVALDELQGSASRAQVEMIHFSLPHGQSPEAVAAWWASLSEGQRRKLELAVPVELADLHGIPNEVKDRLRGPGPLDRVEFVRYALDHWDDMSLDDPNPAVNDCTRFASIALSHAGMEENSDWTDSTVTRLGKATYSWAGSGELHGYLTSETNSHEVPVHEARPGDLIFLRHGAEGEDPGDIHHTAIVTSVTPDGVVHYTQHDDSARNISMQGRERSVEQGFGDQEYIIVRVDPTEK